MKLSFKTILPILLIFTLLILFAGCTTPSEEQPGYTPGSISGIIAAPCCLTSADPVTEPTSCVYPEYWCCYCENTWSLQDGIEVILTYGEVKVATVFTNEDGEYTFTNVPPAKNYVITAYCPDYDDDRPLVKDVALEVVAGKTYDAKITDCVSTALGLVVDYLVENSVLTPEDIVLDGVIAGIPNFYGFPEFKKLVLRICEISTGCVNLFEDEKVPDYLCRAAQEIGRKVLPDLDLGCTPGFTGGGYTPTVVNYTLTLLSDPVEGASSLTGAGIYNAGTLDVAVNTTANPCYTFLNWTVDLGDSGWVTGGLNTEPLQVDMNGNVTLTAHFSCPPISSVAINIVGPTKSRSTPIALQLCMDECATINSVTIKYDCGGEPSDLVITDLTDSRLAWNLDPEISFNSETGAVCLIGGYETGVAGIYNIGVTYTDPCGTPVNGSVNIEFIDCRCVSPTANAGIAQNIEVCPGANALVDLVGAGTGTEPLSYAWDLDDDGDFDDSADQNPQDVAFGATGSPHTVTLQVTNACDSATDEVIITVTESALPTADAGVDQCIQLACASDVEVFFDGSGSSGTGLTYDWDFGDGSAVSYNAGATPSHTYEAGTYTVTLTVTDSCGSSDTDNTLELTVHSACGSLPAQLTISDSDTATSYYLKVKFSDGGGDIIPSTWYYGWCAHSTLEGLPIAGDLLNAYCTLELDTYWPNVNWIVNNRSGYNRMEVQYAIWYFIHHNGENVHNYADGLPWWCNKTNVENLINAALPHTDFCPEIGEKYVVLLTFGTIDSYGNLYKCGPHDQNIMIEVTRVNHCLLD